MNSYQAGRDAIAFLNGQILTMENQGMASAFAVEGNVFGKVGSDKDVLTWAGPSCTRVDLKGRTVTPGFIESHNHISEYAMGLLQADCSAEANQSVAEVKARIAQMARNAGPGKWVRGWGYDDSRISDQRHLTRRDLDEAAPENPVYVAHITDHMAYVNSLALEAAGVTPDMAVPFGGELPKDERGELNGLLVEPPAQTLVSRHIPAYTTEQMQEALAEGIRYFHEFGVTSAHDGAIGCTGDPGVVIRAFRELETAGRLTLRIYLTVVEEFYRHLKQLGLGAGFGSDFLRLGSVKMFQDGSIQINTAALKQPYLNRPDETGELLMSQETLNRLVEDYHRDGLQVAIHANGDRAIESVLEAFERADRLHPGRDLRHMIIHCQMASSEQIRRMKRLRMIPNFFVNHVYYFGDRHRDIFLGPERAAGIDPLRTAIAEEVNFALHSDLPVTPVNPMFSIHCAVNRLTRQKYPLGPQERIAPVDALKAYTIRAARCSFEENIKGSIAPGKLADFVVLSDNPITCDPTTIKAIKTLTTVVGGKVVFGEFEDHPVAPAMF